MPIEFANDQTKVTGRSPILFFSKFEVNIGHTIAESSLICIFRTGSLNTCSKLLRISKGNRPNHHLSDANTSFNSVALW